LQCTQVEEFVLRFSRVADRGPRLQNRPPSDRCKNLATYHGRVPGTCTDKTHTSCSVLGGLRVRARPFRRFSYRFGAGFVRSAQRNIYRPHGHVWYLGRPGAHNLQCFRCPLTTSAVFSRADVGSGDSADHKTTTRSVKTASRVASHTHSTRRWRSAGA